MRRSCWVLWCLAAVVVLPFPVTAGAEYSWQDPHAKVIETGDLQWQPEPFVFETGESVRYIDYEDGDNGNDGKTKRTPWKHHPWDAGATGRASAASGIHTYVFKRGVHYRIFSANGEEAVLRADDSGAPGNPIRLTSDPEWGTGEAVIAGSRPITQRWKKASSANAPARLDTDNQAVWYVDLKLPFRPDEEPGRMAEAVLYVVEDGGQTYDLHLASDVGWELANSNFAMHHWNTWDERHRGGEPYQDDELKGFPADYFEGGIVWSQYAWVIGNATPDRKPIGKGDYDPEKGTLRYKDNSDPANPGTRYLIENLPQFLDKPGEFYYDKQSERLFVRLREDRNPNSVRIELATAFDTLRITERSHIDISGLAFRFNGRNPFPWSSNVIVVDGNCKGITVRNCTFEHIANDGIYAVVEANEEMDYLTVTDCDFHWINGGTAIEISGDSGGLEAGEVLGRLGHAKVLRNRTRNTGLYRHDDHRWSNVPAIGCEYARVAEVAGNVVDNAWGSGIVVQGGKTGKDDRGWDIPLTRIHVHHNKSQYTALGVNDYGGFSIWQHGPVYVYNNVAGNSVGHWAGGFNNSRTVNLSYPLYLDAGFKIYNFNNLIWGRRSDPDDPYSSTSSAFFNVFGFMNPFVNNTVLGCAIGLGGTSGNRNEYLGNIFAEIGKKFISVNHGGNPSLIGGDDPGTSGIDGASTLAYGHNVFHGPATAGVVATEARGAKKDVEASEIDVLARQLQDYPVRFGQLGSKVDELPIASSLPWADARPSASDADFRPAAESEGVGGGVNYFVPWSLYAPVGEWHFNENHWDPSIVLDFHYYPTEAYFHRAMYHKLPAFELEVNEATLADYVDSPSENWAKGALRFDGSRYARVPHDKMASDILINADDWRKGRNWKLPPAPWSADERDMPEVEQGLPDTSPVEFTRSDPEGWVEVMAPDQITPGRKFIVTVRPKVDLPEGHTLAVHVHWMRSRGYGGWNALGMLPQEVEPGKETYKFEVTPVFKPGLDHFLVHTFAGPTSDWGDKTHIATAAIPVAESFEPVDQFVRYPAAERKTLDMKTNNVLVEANVRIDAGHTSGTILGKHDGNSGYRLYVNAAGQAEFQVSAGGRHASVATKARINDGGWHHVLAEIDRDSGRMSIYLDGRQSNQRTASLAATDSLTNSADFLVGRDHAGQHYLKGAIDFMRVCQGTLEDAETDIAELYEWQTNGPVKHDFAGRKRASGRSPASEFGTTDR